jgi:DNA-binding response OmpR family regulator
MVMTDMRMESESAGLEVVQAAKKAPYQPAVAMLTAFPLPGEDWQEQGADEMLVKPMNTQDLLVQIEALLVTHEDKKRKAEGKDKDLELLGGAEKARTPARKVVAAR